MVNEDVARIVMSPLGLCMKWNEKKNEKLIGI